MREYQQFPSPVVLPEAPLVSIRTLSRLIAEAVCKPRLTAPFASKLVEVRTGTQRFRVPTMISEEERQILEQLIASAGLTLDPVLDAATVKRLHKLYFKAKGRPRWLPIPMSEDSLRRVFESAECEAAVVRAIHEAELEKWVADKSLDALDVRASAPTTVVGAFTKVATEDVRRYLAHARLPLAAVASNESAPSRGTSSTKDAVQKDAPLNHSKYERWTEEAKDSLCELKDDAGMTWPQLELLYDISKSRLQEIRRKHLPPASIDQVLRGRKNKHRSPTGGRSRPRA